MDIFYIENYFPYKSGIYDLIGNNFIKKLKQIPVIEYYEANNEELDYIAWKFLGNENAYWIIGLYNDIINPFSVSGIIKIPEKSELLTFLQEELRNATNK